MRLIEVAPGELQQYSQWLKTTETGHIFQSVEWATFKQGSWQPRYFFVEQHGQKVGSVTVFRREIPLLKRPFLYLPRGPVFLDYDDPVLWQQFVGLIGDYARQNQAVFVKLDPAVPRGGRCEQILTELGLLSQRSTTGFGGYEPAATIRCDIRGSEEDVLQRIPKKTRYNIRYPYKKGIVYRHMGVPGLDDYLQVMADTAKRANFVIRTREYYQRLLETFGDNAQLTLAYYENIPVAGGITLVYGDKAWAFSGGQRDSHKQLRAYYGLIWERMLWAKAQGALYFDLYGIPVDRSTDNRLHGIYKFKKSFGGQEYDFLGEYDLPVNQPLYKLWQLLLAVQSWRGKLRSSLRRICQ